MQHWLLRPQKPDRLTSAGAREASPSALPSGRRLTATSYNRIKSQDEGYLRAPNRTSANNGKDALQIDCEKPSARVRQGKKQSSLVSCPRQWLSRNFGLKIPNHKGLSVCSKPTDTQQRRHRLSEPPTSNAAWICGKPLTSRRSSCLQSCHLCKSMFF